MGTGIVKPSRGGSSIAEMKEFAGFPASTQRYIRRSLDVGLERTDADVIWARDVGETAGIRAQTRMYERLAAVRAVVPSDTSHDALTPFMAPLVTVSAFDLGQGRIPTFSAYRFLYERLLGARVRPWLPSSFCAAASLPSLQPDLRRTLLKSLSEAAATAAGWSDRDPSFFPRWVDKVELPRAA